MKDEVFIPGAVETFLSGTGVIQGDPWSDDPAEQQGADDLREAWNGRTSFRRGRGTTIGLSLTPGAAEVLREYMETLIAINYGGDMEWSEVYAARKVIERLG